MVISNAIVLAANDGRITQPLPKLLENHKEEIELFAKVTLKPKSPRGHSMNFNLIDLAGIT